jgi:3',5'-cyclic AMP phosphodiesterase CpdA
VRIIAQISDLHFGRHSPAAAEALLASLQTRRPDLVAVSGDLTQRARRREFAAARRFLDRIAAPKLVVPGNHDVPLYNVFARLTTPFAKYDRFIASSGLADGFYADREIAALGLNTARRLTGQHGRVSHAQIAQIRRVFAAAPPGAFKVLMTHHPLAAATGGAMMKLAGRSALALEAVAAAGVHLLLSGHHHFASHGEIDAELACKSSVLIVHAGTAISTRTRRGERNSYNLIRIDGERVSVAVMGWTAHGFRECAGASYRLFDGAWQPETPAGAA